MYKFRHKIKLDKYSGAMVEVLVDQADQLSVRAIDLVGDAWLDFLEALTRADTFERQQRPRDRNRELQTCLTKLVTHLDGVVSGLWKSLQATHADFRPPKKRMRFSTLKQKIDYIDFYVADTLHVTLPPLDLRLKVLRDLLIHPYVEKPVDQSDVFDITIDDCTSARDMVDAWLGELTALFKYPRGYRTKPLVEDFTRELLKTYRQCGGTLSPDNEIKGSTYRL